MNVVQKASVEFVRWGGVQPNHSPEVVLCCVVVGVVTIMLQEKRQKTLSYLTISLLVALPVSLSIQTFVSEIK